MMLAQLSPALDGVRLSLHVLAATIWVGGQLTLAGLVPTVRNLATEGPRRVARAFAFISWPAYAVLVATGFWNMAAVGKGQPSAWKVVLSVKIVVVVLAGLGAWLHSISRSQAGLAAWGAIGSLASVTALVMGVYLAG